MLTGCSILLRRKNDERTRDSLEKFKRFVHLAINNHTSRVETQPGLFISVKLFGPHGSEMTICDAYSALGYIVAETDRYLYNGNESEAQKYSIHLRMLATYGKWISILSSPGGMKDAPPNTACLIYDDSGFPIRAAVFPNLAGLRDDQGRSNGRQIQQENLQNFFRALGIDYNFSLTSPHHKVWKSRRQPWDCAEVLALLYMFDPNTAAHYYLNGMAANIRIQSMTNMTRYSETDLKQNMLKPACENCQFIFWLLDSAGRSRNPAPLPQGSAPTQGSQPFPPTQALQFALPPQGSHPFPPGSHSGQRFPAGLSAASVRSSSVQPAAPTPQSGSPPAHRPHSLAPAAPKSPIQLVPGPASWIPAASCTSPSAWYFSVQAGSAGYPSHQ
ncbi:hypothetical protein MSAN_00738000 [Mycena sanguinolenta]|uniref:Uncharacterized protein n=1 Tax=Mycena sanguinolenta TaxID=230812 RepID=A0A8H7DG69_9AGAR|nr:hypothetical protein MSAN_00738000 [Mycena sanguinolenta]